MSATAEQLQFERLLLGLRLPFVAIAVLPVLAFGVSAVPYTVLMALVALASAVFGAVLLRTRPETVARHQLALRVLDCLLVLLVLEIFHGFLGNAYYDAVYVLFVVAAAATHGRRGALLLALVAGSFVLIGRLWLITAGSLLPEMRHLTDVGFYTVFFTVTGFAVAALIRRSREIVEGRERMWRTVLEQMPAGVAIAGAPSGNFILGNEQLQRLLGNTMLPAQEVQGYAQVGLLRPDGQPYASDEVPLARSIRTGEVVEAEEIETVLPDGTRATLQVSAAPIREPDGRIVAGVVTCHDVTWRKRTEEAQRFLDEASKQLAGSLEYEATLMSLARLAVPALADLCIVDVLELDGSVRRVAVAHRNPQKQTLARALQEKFPPDPSGSVGVPRALRTGESELISEVTPARLALVAWDEEHLRVLQQLRPRSAIIAPLAAHGRILGAITCIVSESGRRYGPTELALAEDLARRAGVAVDNARLYHDAHAAIQVRDEFLTSASHDLKNPLVSVKGYAQILGALVAQESGPASKQLAAGLAKIDRAATKMSGLIDELLDVAHLQAGRPLELRRRPTDLVALAHQAVGELQPTAADHQIRVEPRTASLVGLWDAARLDRVMANLLSNAIKYSPAGGAITLRLFRDENSAGNWAVLSVQDSGMGIPAADLPHIFERFHRGGNVSDHIRGSGIGLAGVYQIVAQHGGRIGVESQEGEGATFTVRLPLLNQGQQETPRTNPAGLPGTARHPAA